MDEKTRKCPTCHRFWLKEALIEAKRKFLKIETETEYEESKILVEVKESG